MYLRNSGMAVPEYKSMPMNLNMQLDEFKMAVYNSLIQKYVSLHYYPEHCEANKIHDKSWQEYWRWVYIYYAEWANEYLSGQGPDVKELLDNYTVYGHLEKSIAKFWEEKKSLNSLEVYSLTKMLLVVVYSAEYFAQSGTIQCGNERKVMTVELKTIETFKKYQQNKETMVTLIGEYEYRKIQFLKVLSEDKRRQYILDALKKVAAEGKMQS
ncbi:Polymorphic mucin variant IC-r2/1-3.2 [Schistosoma japonicum]|nr:Polymorphic mucin variant IC-r2/1-3.2 [Schistosoma japonicum]